MKKVDKKNGVCFVLDGHVMKSYIEGKDKHMDEMLSHEVEFYRNNEKLKMVTPIQAFMFALFTSENIDGERLKRLVDRVSFNFITTENGKPKVIDLDYLRDEK